MTDGEVFDLIYAPARRFASFLAAPGVEPDDVVQDALARVLARTTLAALDEPLAYLRATMLNVVRNEHRRRTREAAAVERLRSLPGTVPADRSPDTTGLVDALQALSPSSRALVFLVDVEGYAIGEASALVGLSATAARARLSRGRRLIRRQIEGAQP
jgi:RNA polymerase sigma-70 factor (ECF subfamily)